MTNKHTPGPWTYKRGQGRYAGRHYIESRVYSTQTVISGKDQIAQLNSGHDLAEETCANARLIAAAPDLLAALKATLDTEDYAEGFQIPEWVIMARAAIAKAEGNG